MTPVTNELWSLADVITSADEQLRGGRAAAGRVWPSGFPPLDVYLTGGLRSGELILLGGPQGMGKTTFVLQVLRNVVQAGGSGIYFSFEHDLQTILEKLIAVEAGDALGVEALPLRRIREVLEASDGRAGSLADRLSGAPGGPQAVRAVTDYADRLIVHRSSGALTDVQAIREVTSEARQRTGQLPVIVIDYLQKVAVPDGPGIEDERITIVVEGLKDLALELGVPVLAVVAADKAGLVAGKRLRVNDLRGSSALAYEADIVLIMNEKYDVVARHHLVYNLSNAEAFRNWAVVTIEKNRSGLDKIDLEFRKRFEQGRFETDGRPVSEQLVDDRVFTE